MQPPAASSELRHPKSADGTATHFRNLPSGTFVHFGLLVPEANRPSFGERKDDATLMQNN